MAVEIHTPYPSLEEVAKAVGVPLKRAREIERLVSTNGDAVRTRTQPAAPRRAINPRMAKAKRRAKGRAATRRSGRR